MTADAMRGKRVGLMRTQPCPADSLSNVGKSFSRATASAKSDRPTGDDGTMGELLGYNRAKREYAKAFSVNPYSDNPVLQKSLKRLAGAGFFGSFAASAAIPGGAAWTICCKACGSAMAARCSLPRPAMSAPGGRAGLTAWHALPKARWPRVCRCKASACTRCSTAPTGKTRRTGTAAVCGKCMASTASRL